MSRLSVILVSVVSVVSLLAAAGCKGKTNDGKSSKATEASSAPTAAPLPPLPEAVPAVEAQVKKIAACAWNADDESYGEDCAALEDWNSAVETEEEADDFEAKAGARTGACVRLLRDADENVRLAAAYLIYQGSVEDAAQARHVIEALAAEKSARVMPILAGVAQNLDLGEAGLGDRMLEVLAQRNDDQLTGDLLGSLARAEKCPRCVDFVFAAARGEKTPALRDAALGVIPKGVRPAEACKLYLEAFAANGDRSFSAFHRLASWGDQCAAQFEAIVGAIEKQAASQAQDNTRGNGVGTGTLQVLESSFLTNPALSAAHKARVLAALRQAVTATRQGAVCYHALRALQAHDPDGAKFTATVKNSICERAIGDLAREAKEAAEKAKAAGAAR